MQNLSEIREQIDTIDKELIELFKKRMDCAKAVGYYKKENKVPVLNEKRENEILDAVEEKGGEYGAHARLLYSNIMELSRALQHNIVGSGKELKEIIDSAKTQLPSDNINIACQGIKGANSHEAAMRLFPNGTPAFYRSWSDVFEAVESSNAVFGVLPVENSNAGSVSGVYDLILKHRFYIVGAYDLAISNNLCGLNRSEFEDITQAWSHPQALSQCREYLANHNIKAVPSENTAIAAQDISKEMRLNCAAICSKAAAKEYGLKILKEDIQDSEINTTRFIVISKKLYIPTDANKISLCFSLPHVTGSLYSLLCRFNSLGLNLTKIESRPRKGKEFEYLFYLDFTGNVHQKDVIELLSQLSEEMPEFSFLGNYKE